MSVDLTGRHFLSMKDLSAEELRQILQTAHDLKLRRYRGDLPPLLSRKTLAMIFQKPSLRTRVSFESGMTMLGGHAIYLSPGDIKIGERERTEDIARVLSRMADLIMARVFGHDIVEELARHSRVPVINGLSDHEHPCQILADLQTIEEKKGRLAGLRTTYVGDGNNVCHSLMYGAALCGMHFTAACPKGYEPKSHVLSEAQALGRGSGATIDVVNDPAQGARGADVLYTDVWASMGQEAEAAQRREAFRGFQINAGLLAGAAPGAIILHCLPAHYGEEIDYDTARTPNSAIFDQAENRLHAQNALMVLLAGRA
ncbi:MAG: ornithine carbamoyltransferase [Phycisphaerae bacterium]|nr:ornithine carbamoyltransferase [Phycisphaerae bacterium]NUQ46729.1 ornithine carbamoyltransferase [Phycisphaerae bacterium]